VLIPNLIVGEINIHAHISNSISKNETDVSDYEYRKSYTISYLTPSERCGTC